MPEAEGIPTIPGVPNLQQPPHLTEFPGSGGLGPRIKPDAEGQLRIPHIQKKKGKEKPSAGKPARVFTE